MKRTEKLYATLDALILAYQSLLIKEADDSENARKNKKGLNKFFV